MSQSDPNLEKVNSNEENKVHTNPSSSNAFSSSNNDSRDFTTNPQFPSRLTLTRKEIKNDEEILKVFKKVEVNLSLLTEIKRRISRYAKFPKELYIQRRSRSQEKATISRNVFSLLKKNLLEKCVDPGMFSLPCTIGNIYISNAMLDLGALINVMPFSIFKDLRLNGLEKTSICVQLVNWCFTSPLEIVEDVEIKVGNLILPGNFYIIEMNNEYACTFTCHYSLRKIVLKISAKAIINVDKGLLSVDFDGDIVSLNIFDDVHSSTDHTSLCALDTVEILVEILEEHDKFSELINQATLDYVDNEFSKNKPSDDDLYFP